MSSLLFGVGAADALTFVAAGTFLLAVALIACFVPAKRATGLQPAAVLRNESRGAASPPVRGSASSWSEEGFQGDSPGWIGLRIERDVRPRPQRRLRQAQVVLHDEIVKPLPLHALQLCALFLREIEVLHRFFGAGGEEQF